MFAVASKPRSWDLFSSSKLQQKHSVLKPTLLCNSINFRARQRGEGKALLLQTSKSLRTVRARFSKCLRDPAMSVEQNFRLNSWEAALITVMGLGRWKNCQDERRTDKKNGLSPTSKHSALGKVHMQHMQGLGMQILCPHSQPKGITSSTTSIASWKKKGFLLDLHFSRNTFLQPKEQKKEERASVFLLWKEIRVIPLYGE